MAKLLAEPVFDLAEWLELAKLCRASRLVCHSGEGMQTGDGVGGRADAHGQALAAWRSR